MRYRMSVIYEHPVIDTTRALSFTEHVIKKRKTKTNALVTRMSWTLFFAAEFSAQGRDSSGTGLCQHMLLIVLCCSS